MTVYKCANCFSIFERKHPRNVYCSLDCQLEQKKLRGLEFNKNNRAYRVKQSRERRRENKQRAVDLLGGVCSDCKGVFPLACYDFHHLDASAKDINLGTLMNWAWGKQEKELNKCVLLCANCHRIRHSKEVKTVQV